jgi:hypothetical protein
LLLKPHAQAELFVVELQNAQMQEDGVFNHVHMAVVAIMGAVLILTVQAESSAVMVNARIQKLVLTSYVSMILMQGLIYANLTQKRGVRDLAQAINAQMIWTANTLVVTVTGTVMYVVVRVKTVGTVAEIINNIEIITVVALLASMRLRKLKIAMTMITAMVESFMIILAQTVHVFL